MQGGHHGNLLEVHHDGSPHGELVPQRQEVNTALHVLVRKSVQLYGGHHVHLHEGHHYGPPHGELVPQHQEVNTALHVLLF